MANDPIHPQHYKLTTVNGTAIECADAQDFLGLGPGSHLANALKYVWRLGRKAENGLTHEQQLAQDVGKARWYLKRFHVRFGDASTLPMWVERALKALTYQSNLGNLAKTFVRSVVCDAYREQHATWLLLAGNLEHVCFVALDQQTRGEAFDVQPYLQTLITQFKIEVQV